MRSGIEWSLPMVASSSAYCKPMRVRHVSQFETLLNSSRPSARAISSAKLMNRGCSPAGPASLSKIDLSTSGSIALIAAITRTISSTSAMAFRIGNAKRTARCNRLTCCPCTRSYSRPANSDAWLWGTAAPFAVPLLWVKRATLHHVPSPCCHDGHSEAGAAQFAIPGAALLKHTKS